MSARADDAVPTPPPKDLRGAALALAAGVLLAATILVSHAWWIRDEQPTLARQQMCAWAVFGAVLAFAAAAFRARRWIALPVAVVGSLALAAAYAHDVLRPVRTFYPGQVTENVRVARASLAELDRQARDVALWRSGGLPARSIPFGVSGANLRFVPGLPIGIPTYGSSYDLASFEGPAGANRLGWDRCGDGLAGVLPQRRARAEAELAAYLAGLAEPPRSASEAARMWAVDAAGLAAVLLAFNGLALGLRRAAGALSQRARTLGRSATEPA